MKVRLKRLTRKRIAKLIPFPASDDNKYTRGKLYAIGGASEYPGAICMATQAACRMGAGYVETLCSATTLPVLHGFMPDIVARCWEDWDISTSSLVSDKEDHPQACLIGSGMTGEAAAEQSLMLDVFGNCVHPVVVDGGAITVLATEVGRKLALHRFDMGLQTIVTPHFGEASRLAAPVGIDIPQHAGDEDADANALFAQQIADEYGAVVVLKGPKTYIAAPRPNEAKAVTQENEQQSEVLLMDRGTAALAKAGTGDVLAGMTASLAAQGLKPVDAASAAASLHAQCGVEAAAELTEICVCASDLARYLPSAIRHFMG